MSGLNETQIDYGTSSLKDCEIILDKTDTGREYVREVVVNDEPLEPSKRFWTSLFSRYGFGSSIFKYFDHGEVFQRISEVSDDSIRFCVERRDDRNRLLAVSATTKGIIPFEDIQEVLHNTGAKNVTYKDGMILSDHEPRVGSTDFEVMGDTFQNRFTMATPVDGYGNPNIYLSLMRMVCSNGMVAMSKAFRSSINTSKKVDDRIDYTIMRAIDQFNNDEGYAALRNRLESAGTSWASVNEAQKLYEILMQAHARDDDGETQIIGGDGASLGDSPITGYLENSNETVSPIITAFHSMTNDINKTYGLANVGALSAKKQRTLPVDCKVYDLMNFATEVSTHHTNRGSSTYNRLNAFIGDLVTQEYDLEGTVGQYSDFADFHISSSLENQLTG